MHAIQMKEIAFSYSKKPILSGISLNIKKGEFIGIIGKTGCGKSTFLLTLNGIIPNIINGKFSGRVTVLGKNTLSTTVHALARSIAFVFQDPDNQIFSFTVEEEVLFGLKNLGVSGSVAKEKAQAALRTVGLEDELKSDPHTLSHGQKQKLAFACALAIDPEIYILDEPVSSLDYSSSKEIYSVLKKLNNSGKTIIVVEHDTEWIAQYCSRLLFLNDGTIEADGSPLLLLDKRIWDAGIKIPCIARVSKEIGEQMLTLPGLVRYIKKMR
ncbi:MAG: ABC transporter ATP-binding protein [Candidatus Micrarchaeota archaeon]